MAKKKSTKGVSKGQLAAEMIESICGGLAFAAEEELRQTAAWEDWSCVAAEAWHRKHQEGLQSGLQAKVAVRDAGTAAREQAAIAAREWAATWLQGRNDVVLKSLPLREKFEELARDCTIGGITSCAPEPGVAPETGDEDSLAKVLSTAATDALRHGRELATLTNERRTGAQSLNVQQRENWAESFVVDALKSIDYVRSEIMSTALAVLQDAAFERARALADTISRQLAIDATCGRIHATFDEIRASGRGKTDQGGNSPAADQEPSIFWREVRRAAAKILSRQDVHRLVGLHV